MSIDESNIGRVVAYLRAHTNPPVFLISAGLILALLISGAVAPGGTQSVAGAARGLIATYAGWFYPLATTLFLGFVVVVMISPWGRLRLGPEGEKPEYGTWSWIAMVFAAGMGVGLVVYGADAPLFHLEKGPISQNGDGKTEALNLTFYDWGLHVWAIYAVVGLAMGYLYHRHRDRRLPLRPSLVLYPLLGDRIKGWPGKLVDILAVFATVIGLATSLGIGARQIKTGLTMSVMPESLNNLGTTIVIAALVTALAATSLMLGIRKGISRVSVFGIGLTAVFLVVIFAAHLEGRLVSNTVKDIGFYLMNLPRTGTGLYGVDPEDVNWKANGPLFNLGWWLCWAPFVGMFLAEISRGRTIRQFIVGTVFVPAGICILWFSILGRTTLDKGAGLTSNKDNPEISLFQLLDNLFPHWVSAVVGLAAIMVAVLFFAPSMAAGSLVVDQITSSDKQEPVKLQRLGWVLSAGAVAAVLLFVGAAAKEPAKALEALRDTAVVAGLPIAVLLIIACIGLVKVLWRARE